MNKVKYYRLISGLLLKDLSEKTGLSVGHLSHIENGNKQPSKSAMESINAVSQSRQLSYEAAGRYVEKCNRELEEAQEELQAAWEAAGGVCPLCGSEVKENCTH